MRFYDTEVVMKGAAIDIGTNSMRLLLFECKGGSFVFRKKLINSTQLGKDIDKEGFISEKGISKNLKALEDFKNISVEFGADKIRCIATQALRLSKNRDLFVEKARERLDLVIDIISGEEEANLGYKGVSMGIDHSQGGNRLVVDIGGGSTEFILGDSEEILYRESIPIGALMLTKKYFNFSDECEQNISDLKNFINESLVDVKKKLSTYNNFDIIGIGGTITSVVAIDKRMEIYDSEKVHMSKIHLDDLEKQIDMLKSLTVEERKKIPGLMEKRADIIFAGELILLEVIKLFRKKEIVVSEYDNLEGMILGGYFNG